MLATIPFGLGTLSLADAIARQENTPTSWNNPGALRSAPSSFCQTGTIQTANGPFVQFCTPQDGIDAENALISNYESQGLSLSQLISKWAPASDGNNPTQYAENISSWTGLPLDESLNSDWIGVTTGPTLAQAGLPSDFGSMGNGFTDILYSGLNLNFTDGYGNIDWTTVGIVGLSALILIKLVS